VSLLLLVRLQIGNGVCFDALRCNIVFSWFKLPVIALIKGVLESYRTESSI
jgi:hypothetical protein